jgi:hypothetical protein
MKVNKELRDQLLETIDNQIKMNKPPETRLAFDMLKSMGYSEFESKQLIGQCLVLELFHIMKFQRPFDDERYAKNLRDLPKGPRE